MLNRPLSQTKPPVYTDKMHDAESNAFWNPQGIRRDKVPNDIQNGLAQGFYPGALSEVKYASGLEPQRQADINAQLQMFRPQNRGNLVSQFEQQQMGQGNDYARLLAQHLGHNAGIGATQGAQLAALNQSRQNTTDYAAHLASPQGQAEQAQLMQQLYSYAQSNPLLQQFMPLLQDMMAARESSKNRQAAGQQGQGLLGGILQGAGTLAGMGAFGHAPAAGGR